MNDTNRTWADELADEHALLGSYLEQLKDLISAPDDTTAMALSALLDEVQGRCQAHFVFEERDGYMVEVRERQPNLSGSLDALQAEHPTLISELAAIRDAVQAEPKLQQLDQEIAPRIRAWLASMRSHEHRETRIVQEAFNTDIGVGD